MHYAFHLIRLGFSHRRGLCADFGTAADGRALSSSKPDERNGDGKAEGVQPGANSNSNKTKVGTYTYWTPF